MIGVLFLRGLHVGNARQVFGQEMSTQELAQPPTHCVNGQTARTYPIKRKRRERVTVHYTPVDVSRVSWPVLTMLPWYTRARTFNDTASFCIQHLDEVLNHPNPCTDLAFEAVAPGRGRIEL